MRTTVELRARARNRFGYLATFVFPAFLGFGSGLLISDWYPLALVLLALSAATFIFALTKGAKLIEAWVEARYPL